MKSGVVALIGRPNVGKSTLLNCLLGRKIAIMSDRPQTTRSVVRGIVHRPQGQAVLMDTPGLHKPKTLLGERLNQLVRRTLNEVDLLCFLVDGAAGVGDGDRFLARELAPLASRTICVVNKLDLSGKAGILPALAAVANLAPWAEVIPVSARSGEQVDVLVKLLFDRLPEGPALYPDDLVSDEPEQHLIAEIIREKAISQVREELPHSIAVVVEEVVADADREDILIIRADLYVERDSQRPIVLGRGGERLREIGTQARKELETLLGTRIYLDLRVKLAKEWQRDPRKLARFGF